MDHNEKISYIINQTNYTKEIAEEKLNMMDGNYINVIKEYMGISLKTEKPSHVVSVNQEIYKQLRSSMNSVSKERIEKSKNNVEN
jgi:hypothetical protein